MKGYAGKFCVLQSTEGWLHTSSSTAFPKVSKERLNMQTPNFPPIFLSALIIVLVGAAEFTVAAQITRQESTNQLKKVVYTVDPSTCFQFVKKQGLTGTCQFGLPYYLYLYYAFIPIPEITLQNLPSIQVWRIPPNSLGWIPMPTTMMSVFGEWNTLTLGPSFYGITNNTLAIVWKTEVHEEQFPEKDWQTNNICPMLEVTNIFAISNKIVVVYETQSISPFTLGATVSPSQVSVFLPTTVGKTYAVEHTPVLQPTSSWHTLVSNIVGTGGPVLITDSNGEKQRFYRALEQ
jgi:hypothetical protein